MEEKDMYSFLLFFFLSLLFCSHRCFLKLFKLVTCLFATFSHQNANFQVRGLCHAHWYIPRCLQEGREQTVSNWVKFLCFTVDNQQTMSNSEKSRNNNTSISFQIISVENTKVVESDFLWE